MIPLSQNTISSVVEGLHAVLAVNLISYTCLWAVKFSFLFFFKGLGRQVQRQRMLWWSVFAFLVVSYAVAVGLCTDWRCLLGNLETLVGPFYPFRCLRYPLMPERQLYR